MADKDEVETLINELYSTWYPSLLGYAIRSCGNPTLAEDLVQDTLLSLCRDLLKGATIQNPKGWTLTVLRHQISKLLSGEKDRGLEFEPIGIEEVAAAGVSDRDPLTMLVAADEFSHLLSLLTRRQEEVILLRLEGFKYAEIAQQLGIHVSSVKTLVARAIQKLEDRKQTERQQGLTRCGT